MIRRVLIFNEIFTSIVILSVILYANDFIGVKYINLLQVLSIFSSLVLAIMYEKNYKGLKSTKKISLLCFGFSLNICMYCNTNCKMF